MDPQVNDDTLPTSVAAASARDLLWCVIAALVLGMVVVAHQTWTVWSGQP